MFSLKRHVLSDLKQISGDVQMNDEEHTGNPTAPSSPWGPGGPSLPAFPATPLLPSGPCGPFSPYNKTEAIKLHYKHQDKEKWTTELRKLKLRSPKSITAYQVSCNVNLIIPHLKYSMILICNLASPFIKAYSVGELSLLTQTQDWLWIACYSISVQNNTPLASFPSGV